MRAHPFETMMTQAADGVLVISADDEVLFANPASEALFGRAGPELVGTRLGQPIVAGASTEMSILAKGGKLVTVELRTTAITWDGAPAMLASLRDVSERVQAKAQIEHLNSVLRAIRNVNQLIVQERNPKKLIGQACQLLTETRGFDTAWIAAGDGAGPTNLSAHAGGREAFDSFAGLLREGVWPRCTVGALATTDCLVISDPATDCDGCPLASSCGHSRAVITALRYGDQVLGLLGVSFPPALAIDEQETSLLDEVAGDIAFALHGIAVERLRKESEERFKTITESSADAIFIADRQGRYTYVNKAATELLGYTAEELLQRTIADVSMPEQLADGLKQFEGLLVSGKAFFELDLVRKDGTVVPVDLNGVVLPNGQVYGSCRDISARRVLETRRELAQHVLGTLNRETDLDQLVADILRSIKESAGIEAVGIRLRDGDDFPYYETNGFPEVFVDAERHLCERDAAGALVRDPQGEPVLECMCGNILCGRFDPSQPFFTKGGSFWTNSTTQLLATTSDSDRQARTRNRCNDEGFESVALIPLRTAEETIGLLQLNDHRQGLFTLDMIQFFEGIGASIGVAVSRKRAAERISYLADYPENNPNPVFEVGQACSIAYANSAARQWLPTLESAGRAHPLLRDFETIEAACGAPGAVVVRECAEGDRWFEARYSPFQPLGRIRVYCLDITDRKKTEADLQLKNTAVEGSITGITISDLEGTLTYVNSAFAKMLGFEPNELIGKTVSSLSQGNSDEILESVFRQGSWTGERSNHLRKDGSALAVQIAVNLVKDGAGQPMAVMGSFLDISERKELEEQIQASQKMEAIGSLAGGVAHDFNNLLTVILSYTRFALEGLRDGDPLREDLLEVEKAGESAAALTRQLLAFSRKQVLESVTLNLNQIAAGVEKMLGRILGEDVDLVLALAQDLGVVQADPGQMEQVLVNLAVNARDAMPEGGRLTIETSNVELDDQGASLRMAITPGPYVRLSVTDTGCGMDRQVQARLFEPFFTTKERGKGTGLGMSTVYGIVKQLGGSIGVHSELGHGATIEVLLPREASLVAAVTAAPAVGRRTTGTETILVVEDEEPLRRVARRSLEAAGYTVLPAAHGAEALQIASRHAGEINLLLTDVVMPRMNGRALAQALSKRRPTLKVVYMSGYTDDTIVHHGVLDAGTYFIAKPFTGDDLTRKIRNVLDAEVAVAPDAEVPRDG